MGDTSAPVDCDMGGFGRLSRRQAVVVFDSGGGGRASSGSRGCSSVTAQLASRASASAAGEAGFGGVDEWFPPRVGGEVGAFEQQVEAADDGMGELLFAGGVPADVVGTP